MERERQVDLVFRALADPTRRELLRKIARARQTVGELAEPFPVSLAAVSKHLQVLEAAGLVEKERDGRRFVCSIRFEPLAEADQVIQELNAFWEGRLDELEAYLRRRGRGEAKRG